MPKIQFENGTLTVKKGSLLDKALRRNILNADNLKRQERLGVNLYDVGAKFVAMCKNRNITHEVGLDLFEQYLKESIKIL